MIVEQARADIELKCLKMREKHGLTDVEWLQILSGMQLSRLKYMLREERHADSEKPSRLEDI
jgi:hypothetical protein